MFVFAISRSLVDCYISGLCPIESLLLLLAVITAFLMSNPLIFTCFAMVLDHCPPIMSRRFHFLLMFQSQLIAVPFELLGQTCNCFYDLRYCHLFLATIRAAPRRGVHSGHF